MTTIAVLAQGMQVGSQRGMRGNTVLMAYKLQSTQARWATLQGLMVARRLQLRAANRKARRMVGLPLASLPYWVSHRKARAKA